MDQQQRRQIDEAAEQFADALVESYRALVERGVSFQGLDAELARSFFDGVIENLRRGAESNMSASRELIEQQQRQAEAAWQIAQESVNAYMGFVNSLFHYYQNNLQQQQQARGNLRR